MVAQAGRQQIAAMALNANDVDMPGRSMQRLALIAATGLFCIAACSSPDRAFAAGYAVGDEPLAVKAGATVLAQGGTAADAATSMFFTMTVTYPVAAGLGSGGVCLVHSPVTATNEAFEFLPRDAVGGGNYAIPGSVAGFAALQSSYGHLSWQRAVGTAEALAGAGFPISHALALRLRASESLIRLDATLAAEFLNENGALRNEGDIATNADLSQSLATIRVSGQEGFYSGALAQKIVDYSASQGGTISLPELQGYRVARVQPPPMKVGSNDVIFPSANSPAGAFARAMLAQLVDTTGVVLSPDTLVNATAQATRIMLAKLSIASTAQDLGAANFAAVDDSGEAVACAVTMNGPFGSDHTAAGTGITLANASAKSGSSATFLTPVIATQGGTVAFTGAGAGGPNGTAAIIYSVVSDSSGRDSGVRATGLEPFETANAITCTKTGCTAFADPKASGLALGSAAPH